MSINNLRSTQGYTYCDVLERTPDSNLIVKISYPRFFRGNNAFLIDSREQCFKVQRAFAEYISQNWDDVIESILLTRVDIPFTYYMRANMDFNSYCKIYKIFAYTYTKKKNKARSKKYVDTLTEEVETVIYSDTGRTNRDYNNRLMIYNQYENLKSKLGEKNIEEIVHENPDLLRRMRLEVSKRIRRVKPFTMEEFASFDIYGHYFPEYKNYILENVMNKEIIDKLYQEWANELTSILIQERAKGNFEYERFILQNLSTIYDYEVLRRALGICIDNNKTREGAVTKVRKILNSIQGEGKIIILDVYAEILKMRNILLNYEIR
ncbi:MAG: hypothetical protein MR673_00635 [Fusobacterium perfoetens]|uniref:hypothetical protein n=1 Tax=Fusobacterium perfoetens TaxID=852 RepID=UPI0023F57AE1|nr:hypothetical protein [Fusobacterium perfoetens]MCI6151621.1 hypothetical protein [Fusobacterium perfoetens]MDY3237789.1 hypothetical protein [Fusobacterium perfoetens]